MERQNGQFFSFGEFRLNAEKRQLSLNGDEIHLTPKAFDVLVLLVRNRHRVVSREELLEQVWEGAFIEEGNINFNISTIRKTLQQNGADENVYIQTIPKKGYRFVADVVFGSVAGEHAPPPPTRTGRSPSESSRWYLLLLSVLSIAMLTSFSVYWQFKNETGLSPIPLSDRNIKSIAIFPLRTVNGSNDANTLSIAIADSLITRIGNLNRVVVRPLNSGQSAYEKEADPLAAGEQLKVDAVLEGTLIEESNRYRANLRLLDVRDGAQFWSGSFEVDNTDMFRVLDTISTDVARNLIDFLTVSDEAILARQPTAVREAYEEYLKGLYIWNRREMWTDKSSPIPHLQKAIGLDPNFAAAYVALADSYAFTSEVHLAEEAIERAIAIDDAVVGGHATRGFIRMFHYWDWSGSEEEFKKAVAKSPNDPKSHHWYGVLLAFNGRMADARAEMQKANGLDPTSLIIMSDLAQLSYFEGDFDSATKQLEHVLSLDPRFARANEYLFRTLLLKGERNEAFGLFTNTRSTSSVEIKTITETFEREGLDGAFRYELDRLNCRVFDKLNSYACAETLHLLGRDSEALDHLEFCVRERAFFVPYLRIDPIWNSLRTNERFSEIVKRIP